MRTATFSKLFLLALCVPLAAQAFDMSFFGRKPDLSGERRLQVVAGVTPNVPVIFDTTVAGKVMLRPALSEEQSNETRPVYRFEWQADKTARFFELAPPSVLEQLSKQNSIDVALPDGKAYERKVLESFFAGGNVLQKCLPPSKPFRGTITAYVVINEQGSAEKTIVLPEGAVAECIHQAASAAKYPVTTKQFTAKASIRVTE